MLCNSADSHISSLDHLWNVKLFTVTRCTHYLDYTQYQFWVAELHLTCRQQPWQSKILWILFKPTFLFLDAPRWLPLIQNSSKKVISFYPKFSDELLLTKCTQKWKCWFCLLQNDWNELRMVMLMMRKKKMMSNWNKISRFFFCLKMAKKGWFLFRN